MPGKTLAKIDQQYPVETFTFESVTLNRLGELIAHTPGVANQVFEDLGDASRARKLTNAQPAADHGMKSPDTAARRCV